mgnify:CR=1 FL=1
MKKILSALVSLTSVAALVIPMVVVAQATQCQLKHTIDPAKFPACGIGSIVNESVATYWGMCCILDALYTATDWIFVALMIIVALFIAFGGFMIATAAGTPEKVASGRNYILFALVGLAVALLAKALPSVVKALLGM